MASLCFTPKGGLGCGKVKYLIVSGNKNLNVSQERGRLSTVELSGPVAKTSLVFC